MQTEKWNLTMSQFGEIVELLSPSMDDYLYVLDFKEDYYEISSKATQRFLLPRNRFYHVDEELSKVVYKDDWELLSLEINLLRTGKKKCHNFHYRWLDNEKNPVWINCRGNILEDADGSPRFLVGCINEIGEKQKADNVSGLLGESSMHIYLERFGEVFPSGYILRLGLDDFKNINESHGIEYGDYILRKTADIIKANIAPKQKLFRLVADEYAIVDFTGGSVADAKYLYALIRKAIYSFIEENHYKAIYTISGGIVETEKAVSTFEDMMKLTEFTLSEAKRKGKNCCEVFEPEAYENYRKKRQLFRVLHRAVETNFEGFEPYFQPLVKAESGALSGAETLLRFRTPEGEMISPVEFIPILEESGLIIAVGKWVLQKALDACREWQQYLPEFRINVNLSYVQVAKSEVLSDVRDILKNCGVEASSICIELTESGYLEESSHFQEVWEGLKGYGIRLALDDFGTGYSNLHCLCDLKPSYVKIDRSFTFKALNREYEFQLLHYIVEMSHSLGLQVCIEGIETEEELARAKCTNPDFIQGYLFGRPISRSEFFEKFFK